MVVILVVVLSRVVVNWLRVLSGVVVNWLRVLSGVVVNWVRVLLGVVVNWLRVLSGVMVILDLRPLSVVNLLCKYADDLSQLCPQHSDTTLEEEYIRIQRWADCKKLLINTSKTKEHCVQTFITSPIRSSSSNNEY